MDDDTDYIDWGAVLALCLALASMVRFTYWVLG